MSGCTTAVRRVLGPHTDELYLLCRPGSAASASAPAARQAEAVYEALLETLSCEGVGADALVRETVFLSRIRENLTAVRDARHRVLGRVGAESWRPATTFIGQAPTDEGACLEVSVVALLPHRPRSWSAAEVCRSLSCGCETCSDGARARVVREGDRVHCHAGGIHGSGSGAFDEAYDMFRVARDLLAEAGMSFGDVMRTWIYLRDIDRDYDDLNRARREFFRECGIERQPASTGVQGIPFPDGHDFCLGFYALQSSRPIEVNVMSTPTLNEAWTYGADFSRGLRVVDANRDTLHVSGTASVDERGRSAHVGDFTAQADRMLLNIESLLAAQGATFAHVVSAVTYLKNPNDAPVLRAMFRERGFEGFPCAVVEAPLCRPELLCETEAVAALELPSEGA